MSGQSPFGNIFDKVKSGAKQTAEQMGRAAKIAKLNVELNTQKGERDRHLKTIGSKVFAIYSKDKNLDAATVTEEVTNELNQIERIDKRTEELQGEIAALQAEFRSADGVVDASEVKDTTDEASEE